MSKPPNSLKPYLGAVTASSRIRRPCQPSKQHLKEKERPSSPLYLPPSCSSFCSSQALSFISAIGPTCPDSQTGNKSPISRTPQLLPRCPLTDGCSPSFAVRTRLP